MSIAARLWTADAKETLYGGDALAYQAAILEQYKLHVEMADRISQRRGLTNGFFLSLNTAIFTAVGLAFQQPPARPLWWWAFLLAMLLGQCFAWFYLLRSYRLLNAAKYQVLGALESRLPASPYGGAEWKALGEGKDMRKYWPLSLLESAVPAFFAALYTAGFLALWLHAK